jgi:hypothetical protein
MESGGSGRSRLLKAGGVLSIMAGATEIIGGLAVVALILVTVMQGGVLADSSAGSMPIMIPILIPIWAIFVAAALLVLGMVAVMGGVSALRRNRFRTSLAGAIYALPIVVLGIPSVVLIALRRAEFGARA